MSEINLPHDLPVTEARTILALSAYWKNISASLASNLIPNLHENLATTTSCFAGARSFYVLYLDNQNRLLQCETLFTGRLTILKSIHVKL